MKKPLSMFMLCLSLPASLPLLSCSSDSGSDKSGTESNEGAASEEDEHTGHSDGASKMPGDFPPPAEGYTRFVAPVIEGIAPGTDVTHCQYIQAPLDRDIDVMDAEGYQSEGGHHAVAFASKLDAPLGTNRDGCGSSPSRETLRRSIT